jgi:hypothetical protein
MIGWPTLEEVVASWDPKAIAERSLRCFDPGAFIRECACLCAVEMSMAGATADQADAHVEKIGRAAAVALRVS